MLGNYRKSSPFQKKLVAVKFTVFSIPSGFLDCRKLQGVVLRLFQGGEALVCFSLVGIYDTDIYIYIYDIHG